MTTLNLLRIDERLIHGQIITSWLTKSRADTILIVDNFIPQDTLQCDLLAIATPPATGLKIMSVRDAAIYINSDINASLLLLLKTPMVVAELISEGVCVDEVNVGNMGSKSDRTRFATTLWLTSQEKQAFNQLISMGKKVKLQVLPTDSPTDLAVLLGK